MTLKTEIETRQSYTAKIIAYFTAHPGVWIDARDLAAIGGFCSWRTRVSDARQQLAELGDGTIEWNHKARQSAYRFVPHIRLGRDAAEQVPSPWDQDRPFGEAFKLT